MNVEYSGLIECIKFMKGSDVLGGSRGPRFLGDLGSCIARLEVIMS